MIHANLRGRLGNQLFIYAMARALQEKTGDTVSFNSTLMHKETPNFEMSLNQYLLGKDICFEHEKPFPWYASMGCLIIKTSRKFFPRITFLILSKMNVFLWLGEEVVNVNTKSGKDVYIDGYWQSPKYFEAIKSKLRQELTPIKPISDHNIDFVKRMQESESVCITIRHGNYVSNKKFKEIFYVCDENYFNRGIEEMQKHVQNPTWFVFSDDINWVKENFTFQGDVYFETGDDSVSEKLYIMSKCKHFVISNSSFSWWAQYFGEASNKVVVAPDKWFTDGRRTDIYENSWILIPV